MNEIDPIMHAYTYAVVYNIFLNLYHIISHVPLPSYTVPILGRGGKRDARDQLLLDVLLSIAVFMEVLVLRQLGDDVHGVWHLCSREHLAASSDPTPTVAAMEMFDLDALFL